MAQDWKVELTNFHQNIALAVLADRFYARFVKQTFRDGTCANDTLRGAEKEQECAQPSQGLRLILNRVIRT